MMTTSTAVTTPHRSDLQFAEGNVRKRGDDPDCQVKRRCKEFIVCEEICVISKYLTVSQNQFRRLTQFRYWEKKKASTRPTESQRTYLESIRSYGQKLAKSARMDSQITILTGIQLMLRGKRLWACSNHYHTLASKWQQTYLVKFSKLAAIRTHKEFVGQITCP